MEAKDAAGTPLAVGNYALDSRGSIWQVQKLVPSFIKAGYAHARVVKGPRSSSNLVPLKFCFRIDRLERYSITPPAELRQVYHELWVKSGAGARVKREIDDRRAGIQDLIRRKIIKAG